MKTIKINAIQFAEILGHESYSLLLCTDTFYYPGDEVKLIVYSVNDNVPTGAEIKRFVVDVLYLGLSREEDTYLKLLLSALRPSFSTLA
jgi:hypothetical protein